MGTDSKGKKDDKGFCEALDQLIGETSTASVPKKGSKAKPFKPAVLT